MVSTGMGRDHNKMACAGCHTVVAVKGEPAETTVTRGTWLEAPREHAPARHAPSGPRSRIRETQSRPRDRRNARGNVASRCRPKVRRGHQASLRAGDTATG